MEKQVNGFGWNESNAQLVSRFISQQIDSLKNNKQNGKIPKYISRENVENLLENLDELIYYINEPVNQSAVKNNDFVVISQFLEMLTNKHKEHREILKNIESAINLVHSEWPESQLPF